MAWLLPLAWLLLLLPCTLITSHGQDLPDPECTIYIRQHEHVHLVQDHRRSSNGNRSQQAQQRPAPPSGRSQPWTAAVAPGPEGITVVWQEADSVFLRRFGHDCRSRGYPCVVSSSRNFVRGRPVPSAARRIPGSFLDEARVPLDAVASGGIAASDTAVASGGPPAPGISPSPSGSQLGIEPKVILRDATALKDGRTAVAWTRDGDVWVSVVGDEAGPPVRASGDGRFQREDVTLTATPDGKGFVIAWSSFGQDGDGWGIVARMFNGEAKPDGGEHLVNADWHGSQRRPQLMACVSGAAGPAVWALWGNGTSNTSHELFVRRLASGASWAPDQELRVTERLPQDRASPLVLSSMALMCATGSSTEDPTVVWAVVESGNDRRVRWRAVVEIQQGVETNQSHSALVAEPPARQFLKHPNRSRSEAKAIGNSSNESKAQSAGSRGQLLLRAEGDVLAVASEDEHGGVSVQLFDMMPTSPYPTHQMMTIGSTLQQIAYDVTADQALITCWSHLSGLSCERRHLQALMEQENEPMTLWFAIVIFVVLFWCRHELMTNGGSSARQVQPIRSSNASIALRDLRARTYFDRSADVLSPPSVPRSMWRLHQQSKYI